MDYHRIILTVGIILCGFNHFSNGQLSDGQNLYSKRYEALDIDTILASPRLVTNYVECLLNRKPCPPEGKDLKRILPEALRTKCSRCWPSQKEGALKVITKLYYDYPKQYAALRQRWDPTGEYHRRFEEYLRDHQFNVISGNGLEADINRGDQSQITVQVSRPDRMDTTRRMDRVTPQIQTTTNKVATSDLTQRPTRQNDNPPVIIARDEQPPPLIANRFGDDPTEFNDNTANREVARPMAMTSTSTTTPKAYMDPTYYSTTISTFKTRNPIINLINRLTLKFSSTADFLAGMIRNTVKPKTLKKKKIPSKRSHLKRKTKRHNQTRKRPF